MFFLSHDLSGKDGFGLKAGVLSASIVVLLWFFVPFGVRAEDVDAQTRMSQADSLFREGKFAESEALYSDLAQEQPDNYHLALMLGKINLYENALEESEKWLKKAVLLEPEENDPRALLAEAYCRQDDFSEAASLYRGMDKTSLAERLEYLSRSVPYEIKSDLDITTVEFVQTDPLPVVKMRINDSQDALFLIDTGGWELSIDTELAQEVGAEKFGSQTATYAGGKQATTYQGVVGQVRIGDFTVNNVPVNISDAPKRIAAMFGMPIRGVIGTVFLYHFVFTLDYPGGKLVLQRRTDRNVERLKGQVRSKDNMVVPFWMAGDHFMVAWGTVNRGRPMLLFVDTGLAGGGFSSSKGTAEEAGIKLPEESLEGQGGGGKVAIKPAMVDELTLGDAREKNVMGIFGAFDGTDLEHKFGFRIGGIISHGFFRPYKLTFDFSSMNLILQRGED